MSESKGSWEEKFPLFAVRKGATPAKGTDKCPVRRPGTYLGLNSIQKGKKNLRSKKRGGPMNSLKNREKSKG